MQRSLILARISIVIMGLFFQTPALADDPAAADSGPIEAITPNISSSSTSVELQQHLPANNNIRCKKLTITTGTLTPGTNTQCPSGYVPVGLFVTTAVDPSGTFTATPTPWIFDWENPNWAHPFRSYVCSAAPDCNDPEIDVTYPTIPGPVYLQCALRTIAFPAPTDTGGPCTN